MSAQAPQTQALASLRARNLRTVGALAALFMLPLLAAFLLYYGLGWRPSGHTNYGELIQPPLPLEASGLKLADGSPAGADLLRRQWTLVYVGAGDCDESCRHALYVMRQTRLGLNTDMTRVRRVFLATGACCDRAFLEREHQGLILVDASAAPRLLAQFPADERSQMLFIVDPLGNLMMRYDARRNPRGLFEDLKKLLQLSHIG
ncbi:MAG TPA: hypothetical protein VLW26_06505 [Steroidobacteraceae bacterium]|nr:hypothetical protein [Steroidobacteraceae bacterium]